MFIPIDNRTRRQLAAIAERLGVPAHVFAAIIVRTALDDIGVPERLFEARQAKEDGDGRGA